MKQRIYRYDNIKALLILLVVIGHMTTDYVSDNHLVRWTTLWIYTFHMPAFIFLAGLVHKQYITEKRASRGIKGETRFRADKALGFFLCGYTLKVFLQLTRTLMGQKPLWHWIEEPGIPWYLFVMAEYEILFFILRHISDRIRPWVLITGAFALSAVIGYFPEVGDAFCLSRMINFLPIYMLGYFLDMRKVNSFMEGRWKRLLGWAGIAASLIICATGKWSMYSWRKWFTGRRSYEFLQDYFSFALKDCWWIRLGVWAFALALTFCIIAVIPDRDFGFITKVGSSTLNIYFWHRPVCYLFRNWAILPRLCVLFGGTYDEAVAGQVKGLAFGGSEASMIAAYAAYLVIGAAMTALFALKPFRHPCSDIMKFSAKVTRRRTS